MNTGVTLRVLWKRLILELYRIVKPKQALQDKPKGRRNGERWKDEMTLRVREKALRLTL